MLTSHHVATVSASVTSFPSSNVLDHHFSSKKKQLFHRCKAQDWRQVGVKPTCLGRKRRRLEKETRTLDSLVIFFGLWPSLYGKWLISIPAWPEAIGSDKEQTEQEDT